MFEGHEHVSLLRLPGMEDRCVRIGSAGKTFSLTGWKVRGAASNVFLLISSARPGVQAAVLFTICLKRYTQCCADWLVHGPCRAGVCSSQSPLLHHLHCALEPAARSCLWLGP